MPLEYWMLVVSRLMLNDEELTDTFNSAAAFWKMTRRWTRIHSKLERLTPDRSICGAELRSCWRWEVVRIVSRCAQFCCGCDLSWICPSLGEFPSVNFRVVLLELAEMAVGIPILRNRLFAADSRSVLSQRVQLGRLRWWNTICIWRTRLACRALLSVPPSDWKKLCGSQMIWYHRMRKYTLAGLGLVSQASGPWRLSKYTQNDDASQIASAGEVFSL